MTATEQLITLITQELAGSLNDRGIEMLATLRRRHPAQAARALAFVSNRLPLSLTPAEIAARKEIVAEIIAEIAAAEAARTTHTNDTNEGTPT